MEGGKFATKRLAPRCERIEIGIVFGIGKGGGNISAFRAVDSVSKREGGGGYKRRKGEEEWEVGGRVGGKYARCARAGSRARSSENLISPCSFLPSAAVAPRVVLEFSKNFRVEHGIFDEPKKTKEAEYIRDYVNPKQLGQLFPARSEEITACGNCV